MRLARLDFVGERVVTTFSLKPCNYIDIWQTAVKAPFVNVTAGVGISVFLLGFFSHFVRLEKKIQVVTRVAEFIEYFFVVVAKLAFNVNVSSEFVDDVCFHNLNFSG